jgi:dimethylargininase
MPIAYTRAVSPALSACALTHIDRTPIDVTRAEAQHAAYEQALRKAGCTIHRLPPLPDAPDGVFVEDTAIVLGEHVIITRPGAAARADETASTAIGLADRFTLHHLSEGTLDGGDVLRVERTLFVGESTRTDDAGAAALARLAGPLGFEVVTVRVLGCLHLKSAVTWLGDGLLLNPEWVDPAPFGSLRRVSVAAGEAGAANTLRIGDIVLSALSFPSTARLLEGLGYGVELLDASELQKAEAGISCMSLIAGS